MRQIIILILMSMLILSPSLSIGQGGIGGRIVHEPDLGCACVEPFDTKIRVDGDGTKNNSSALRKLSAFECRQRGDVEKVYRGPDVDQRVKILDKPAPELPPSGSTVHTSGQIVLQAVFCPNGTVGRVSLVTKLSDVLDESAIKAAKKIKFQTAVKNGEPVAQFMRLEYIFGSPP